MWPFRQKSLQERIGELEDQLAGLRAQWTIHNSVKWGDETPFWHIEQLADLRDEIATRESKLARLKRELEPWKYDPLAELEAKSHADRT